MLEGDEWRNAPEPKSPMPKRLTRAERQASHDEEYGKGRIGLPAWRLLTGDCSNMAADGSPMQMPEQ